ncbi:MAG: hypothetical protein F6K09_34000, partial [Merismopedia sp. SIO2A8]|nr:hypothetical protein [Merismopedia sp. SIO2A8]
LAELEKVVEAIAPKEEQSTHQGSTAPTEGVALALSLNGLQAINVQTGSIRNLEFDGESDLTHQVVTDAFGTPTQTTEAGECPAGPMAVTSWSNGLSINTANQKFIGWSVRPGPANKDLTTITGVGIGTSLNDMQKAYTVEVFDSSLGVEFNVGQMSGLLSANAPEGVITDLWAGTNCIFR